MSDRPLIGLIAYGAGNMRSLTHALSDIDCTVMISQDPVELERCDKIVFPGVGEANSAMEHISRNGLRHWISSTTKSFLGICLGMQVLYERSTERSTPCLGILPGVVDRLRAQKVPHIGWNSIDRAGNDPLFTSIPPDAFFYFAHSYAAPVTEHTLASTEYGQVFASAVRTANRWGVQFHPEKSGAVGSLLLRNFIERC